MRPLAFGLWILSSISAHAQGFTVTTPSPVPDGFVGVAYRLTLAASGGAPPYLWTVSTATPLPPGLMYGPDPATIAGIPTEAGQFSFFVQATDSGGKFATKTLVITIGSPPVIGKGGVVNAASYAQDGMPNAGIARGSVFVVFGSYLGAPGLHSASGYPLPAQRAGTSVRVVAGGTRANAPVIYATPTQVAALLPSSTPIGAAQVIISYNGFDSAPAPIQVVNSRFGIFSRNSAGTGPAIVQSSVYALNSHTESAQPGEIVVLWGTGLGPVTGNEAAGPLPGDLKTGVEVLVGNQHARVLYQGRSGCCAGIDQINFEVPKGIEGCFVPVAVSTGAVVSNVTSMSISSSGKVCSDPTGFSTADLLPAAQGKDFRVGSVELFRASISGTVAGTAVSLKQDIGAAGFYRFTPAAFAATQGALGVALRGGTGLASYGSCNVYPMPADSIGIIPDPIAPEALPSGGAVNIAGPHGARQLEPAVPGVYTGQLGGDDVLGFAGQAGAGGPLYLDSGTYTVDNGAGTPAIGPFRASLTVANQISWSNQLQLAAIDRTRNLTVTWTGGNPAKEFIIVAGLASDDASNAAGVFVCTERADAGTFTVPSWVLSTLPIVASPDGPNGLLWVGNMSFPQQGRFTAAGLDAGYLYYLLFQFQFVSFR